MYSALYYPHTSIESESLIKTALLLWDQIEYIVPYEGFKPERKPSGEFARALELIARPHCPTADEKKLAHAQIADLVEQGTPEPFKYRIDGGPSYELWPSKLMGETWELLRSAGLIGGVLDNQDYPASRPAGLCVMSILADCCAGSTRLRVTDQGEAYAAVTGLMQNQGTEPFDSGRTVQETLVPLALRVVNTSQISISKLIEFRTREAGQGGHDYRALRHRYVDRMETCLTELGKPHLIGSDRKEIARQFETDMKDDLATLRDELGYSSKDVLFSKEMIAAYLTTVVALGAAAVAAPLVIPGLVTLAGAPVAIGGLVSLRNKYLASRQAIMHKHPMAYLYELAR